MTTHITYAKKHFANVPTKFHDDDADAKYKVHHRWIVQLDQFGQECDQQKPTVANSSPHYIKLLELLCTYTRPKFDIMISEMCLTQENLYTYKYSFTKL